MTAIGIVGCWIVVAVGMGATCLAGMTVLRARCRHRWAQVAGCRERGGVMVTRQRCLLCGEHRIEREDWR